MKSKYEETIKNAYLKPLLLKVVVEYFISVGKNNFRIGRNARLR